jgi:hypothetical protein
MSCEIDSYASVKMTYSANFDEKSIKLDLTYYLL